MAGEVFARLIISERTHRYSKPRPKEKRIAAFEG